jgi:predicted acetyltransferase
MQTHRITIIQLDKLKYFAAIKTLYSDCFQDGKGYIDFYFNNMFSNNRCFGIIEDNTLVSMAFITNKTIIFNLLPIKCPLISAVCVKESHRNRGYAFRLIEHIKNTLKDEGFSCIYLSPVNPAIYKKNSFIPFCYEEDFEINYDGKSKAILQKANFEDIDILLKAYCDFTANKNAFCLRKRIYFEMLLKASKFSNPIYLIYENKKCLGYIYFDDTYWDISVKPQDLCKVEALNGKIVSIAPSDKKQRISQMICILDDELVKNKESIFNSQNVNFDKY